MASMIIKWGLKLQDHLRPPAGLYQESCVYLNCNTPLVIFIGFYIQCLL